MKRAERPIDRAVGTSQASTPTGTSAAERPIDRAVGTSQASTPPASPTSASRAAPAPLRFRVQGFSLLPAVPPGVTVEIAPSDGRRPVPGDLVVVRIRGALTCHVVESIAPGPEGSLVTRGLWASAPDPTVPADALVGLVTAVRLGALRVPTAGFPFRSWLAAGRSAAPLLRLVRTLAWSRVPSSWKERLRRGFARRVP